SDNSRGVWLDSPVWIVRLQPGASIDQIASERLQGRSEFITQRYSQIINGFAAKLPAEFVEILKADPRVMAVMPDFEVQAYAQTIPSGIKRINATQNVTAGIDGVDQRVDVDVAVLDTGVSNHSDLNVVGGKDCTGAGSWSDAHGHGTHVAGTIGALDNGNGVVGVAPGARIWSVRVLNAQGSGYGSWILCGVDWVTANAGTIEVANMSLGGKTSYVDDGNCGRSNGDVMHQAICESVQAGVTYVVAAGNDSANAAGYFPASYDEVVTVSALVDTDGKEGGLGGSTSVGRDDALASFSNFGADVDVIAPGVSIYSTSRTGGYATMSGTSMASPHVAGAAALQKAANPSASPADVRSALIASGSNATWTDDRDSTKEPLIDASKLAGGSTPTPPPPPPPPGPTPIVDAQAVSVSGPASINRGSAATVNVSVKNNGTASATISVKLTETPGGFTQTKSISLAAGATGSLSYSWATNSSTAAGSHTMTATTTLSSDSNAGNNTASTTINVVAPATPAMSVTSLSLASAKSGNYYRLTSQAQIRANGVAVSGARVTVEFQYPNGTRYTMAANTNSSGTAAFTRTVTAKGTYKVTVKSVTKTGSTYNPAGNTISTKSVTVR
ncbi:MAG TPA: S8 family serine peptidase, partial [Thermomicrobiales bacterium]|nr:S8 family serine peptidase [Thermomicrobiales bacterium]